MLTVSRRVKGSQIPIQSIIVWILDAKLLFMAMIVSFLTEKQHSDLGARQISQEIDPVALLRQSTNKNLFLSKPRIWVRHLGLQEKNLMTNRT